jgi:uncharacterized protein (TIGR03437 family)
MKRQRKLLIAKTAVILGAVPLLIWAYELGPDAGVNGVPGEATCAVAGCHVATVNDPANKGSVSVAFPNGQTYTPGVKQHLVVTVSDPAATQKAWGFQLTARAAGSPQSQQGTFASTDARTTIMCATANLSTEQESPFVSGKTQTCAATLPLQYVEHSLAGYNGTKGPGSGSFEFDWTPPASATGNIVIYVAGNAANGDLTNLGDHIYTTSYTLTQGTAPAISFDNIQSASAFGGYSAVAPGSWVELFGSGLSGTTRQWAGGDFTGNKAPTLLDNVKVTIGGQSAFVYFISPAQVNAQVPSNVATGPQQVTVTNGSTTTSARTITVNALQPGLLSPAQFAIGGKQYVVAQFIDNSFVMPPGTIAGQTTRQVKPGETIVIYGIGFGPVQDSGGQDIPAGTIVTSTNKLAKSFSISIGGQPATLLYQGLAPNFVGLYQFNVTVPNVPDNDLTPLSYTLDGAAGPQTLFLAVHQ